MNQIIQLALVDDHPLFRSGIKSLFRDQADIEVLMEAADGQDFLNRLDTAKILPDIVLLDIRMPQLDGYDTASVLLQEYPSIRIIVLTMHEEERHIVKMLELGVNGYLMKNAPPNEVIEGIRYVMEHDYYFNHKIGPIMRKVMMYASKPTGSRSSYLITKRELDILQLICKEYTNKEIADALFLSFRTVEGYRKKLIAKLPVRNTAGLVVYALKHDLVQLE